VADVPRAPIRLTPNLFAISFGLAGLAECWSTAAELTTIPSGVGDALWVVTAALWVVIGLAY
jgi:tellurite resistance protein